MPEKFLCLTCEKKIAGADHIKGFTTFGDIKRDWQAYVHRIFPQCSIKCDFCGNNVNSMEVDSESAWEMVEKGEMDLEDYEELFAAQKAGF